MAINVKPGDNAGSQPEFDIVDLLVTEIPNRREPAEENTKHVENTTT